MFHLLRKSSKISVSGTGSPNGISGKNHIICVELIPHHTNRMGGKALVRIIMVVRITGADASWASQQARGFSHGVRICYEHFDINRDP